MAVILRLQCDDLLGGRIERETLTGLVTIATVARGADGLTVHVTDGREGQGLEYLQGLRARDCNELQRRMGRTDVTVTMPTG
ncbi:hypothetical protein [Microvirga yunnanensis]|uniref:hypothetical protein n=1 Tax=Microvirga yunnanensis TaxID=2953740 RepID=UPI0021C752E1|nr:hypothetical protein [Microvirga sp. HBU65207]